MNRQKVVKTIEVFFLMCFLISSFVIPPVVQSSSVSSIVFISKSSGLDTPQKEGGCTELELADMNNDGFLDIISVGDHGSPYVNSDQHGIMVWLGDGGSYWTVHQNGEFGYGGCEAGDLNLDGYLDVVWGIHHDWGVPGFGDTLIGAALGDGTGMNWVPWATGLASSGEDWGMFASDLADFDCNGLLDIISLSFGCCNGYHLYENHGDGNWSQAWELDGGNANYNLEVGDFNADGFPDFVGTREYTYVFIGNGSFGFTMNQNGIPSGDFVGVDCGDMDNDGGDDIVFGLSGSTGVHCYRFDTQSEMWISASNGLPTSGTFYTQFGDVDGDGFLDIIAYDEPMGTAYLGDGAGNWVADGSFTMPSPGYYSAFVVDGDFDHDGREDVVIQGEEGSWPSYINKLRAFSPWNEPTSLSALVTVPHGGETYRTGSIRDIRWLAGVPPSQGDATVDLYYSLQGSGGPWNLIAADIPNNGCYQWLVDAGGSQHGRIKVVVSTGSDSVSAISENDVVFLGFNVDAHGPYYAGVGESIQFTGSADGGVEPYDYLWDFGDGNTSSQQNPTYTYYQLGNYTVVLSVTDATDLTVCDTTFALIQGENTPPEPPTISGPPRGKVGQIYMYTVSAVDPDGHPIFYNIDWGDGTFTEWDGPYPSGAEEVFLHNWSEKGTYIIRVRAKDLYGAVGEWATLKITIPLNIPVLFDLLLQYIQLIKAILVPFEEFLSNLFNFLI